MCAGKSRSAKQHLLSNAPLGRSLLDTSSVYERYHSRLTVYAETYTSDPDEAADAVQTVFFRLLRAGIPPGCLSYRYLKTAVRNECWHTRRNRQRNVSLQAAPTIAGTAVAPADEIPLHARRRLVSLIERLPARCFEITWAVAMGCSYKDVARHFRISPKTVSAHMQRARYIASRIATVEVTRKNDVVGPTAMRRRWAKPVLVPGWPHQDA